MFAIAKLSQSLYFGGTNKGRIMTKLMVFCLLISYNALAQSIAGTVEIKGDAPKGVLFIFAKKFDGKMPMPLAVQRVEKPNFPVKFSLSQDNAMMKQMPFKGPFKVTARISPSGSAMDKSGIEVSTTKAINLGDKNIKLVLEKK
jgi:hypothetical protein